MTQTALAVIDLAEKRSAAFIRRGQRAWAEIKRTAEEQRTLWLEVGVALFHGRALNTGNQAFGKWCAAAGFDMDPRVRSDAIWLAANWDECSKDWKTEAAHPTTIRALHKAATATQALPEDLQAVTTTQAPVMDQRSAEKAAKVILRAASGDEGAATAARQVEGMARKEGLTVAAFTEAAKAGAPDTYFRFAPQLLEQIEEFRGNLRISITEMEESGISREAIRALFIHFANTL